MILPNTNTVELIGYYGGDETHACSGWTSTSHELTDEKRARIPAFLKQLAEAGHHTPFEKSMLHFIIRCETASHIHLLKHRIAVSVNGESANYKELKEDKLYVPVDWPPEEQAAYAEWCDGAYRKYHEVLARLTPTLGRKRAKGSARFYLPYGNQLWLDVSFNFRSWMAFMKLRNDDHAQLEIHQIAAEMLELVRGTGAFGYSLEGFGYAEV